VDPEQPEQDGSPGVAQIDALVVHPWGMFIVEIKSVSTTVSVRDDGSGGDEWSRLWNGRWQGMASPIQQARRQAEFLRSYLHLRRESLLGRLPVGLRTFGKLVAGSDQRGFSRMPIQIIVAVSDRGIIQRKGGWKPPAEPFRCFDCKADLVAPKIEAEFEHHRKASSLTSDDKSEYGKWWMKKEEAAAVAQFLAEQHTARSRTVQTQAPLPPIPKPAPSAPAQQTRQSAAPTRAPVCRQCGGTQLAARWGKYGYYWSCASCEKNTPMPTVCSVCGAVGERRNTVRIRKDGPQYFRKCEPCGIEEVIWREPNVIGPGSAHRPD